MTGVTTTRMRLHRENEETCIIASPRSLFDIVDRKNAPVRTWQHRGQSQPALRSPDCAERPNHLPSALAKALGLVFW
jgi:hypothetical protein